MAEFVPVRSQRSPRRGLGRAGGGAPRRRDRGDPGGGGRPSGRASGPPSYEEGCFASRFSALRNRLRVLRSSRADLPPAMPADAASCRARRSVRPRRWGALQILGLETHRRLPPEKLFSG